ncbi:hypothetical protein CMV60_05555 [Serratia marcescens]|nr:hypothetical protein CMV60_05555 [Serratia marcescens]
MPTIKDIAKLAGVSHGTVSNVLNGRGNVSVKKINAVMDAARQLDYKPMPRPENCARERGWGSLWCCPILPPSGIAHFMRALRRLYRCR